MGAPPPQVPVAIAEFGEWFGMDAQQTSLAVHGLGGVLLAWLGGFLMIVGAHGWSISNSILDPEKARPRWESWSDWGGGLPRDAVAELDLPQTVRDRLDEQEVRLKVSCGKCRASNDRGAKYCYLCSARL